MAPPLSQEPGDLERFRPYLRILAEMHLDRKLRGRCEPSDVVQETLLEAHRDRAGFSGRTEAELAVWLRRILVHNLADLVRAEGAQKRDVERERSLEKLLERSSMGLGSLLADSGARPSAGAARREEALLLAESLETIPAEEREVVVLRYCRELTLREIAEEVQVSATQAARLLARGLRSLRADLVRRGLAE